MAAPDAQAIINHLCDSSEQQVAIIDRAPCSHVFLRLLEIFCRLQQRGHPLELLRRGLQVLDQKAATIKLGLQLLLLL